ncbi:hypothetical protein DFH07DRAFT_985486 [Mycena maculata]|uniref:Uncharacterized protein n=1 Tax=Mycena maculata TaxID=230809 RepID=A0AAD7MZI4_9AGAR|nr:hypothetical protein DFH07DRAFT_985486 [Mycena maculata]
MLCSFWARRGRMHAQHPEPTCLATILQLNIFAGITRGLTRTAEPAGVQRGGGLWRGGRCGARHMGGPMYGHAAARARCRAVKHGFRGRAYETWIADGDGGQALSELFHAIAVLPLPLPAPAAAWHRVPRGGAAAAHGRVARTCDDPHCAAESAADDPHAAVCAEPRGGGKRSGAVGEIVSAALNVLGAPGGMIENPDIMQEFFACMDCVAQDFTGAFCALPDRAFDALMQCAISALALQERYSLVAACTFLGTLIHRTALYAPISPELLQQLQVHMICVHGRAIMRAVLCGFAGTAPRSATPQEEYPEEYECLMVLTSRWEEGLSSLIVPATSITN